MHSVSKIVKHSLSTRLRIWYDDHNIIDESQAGFRRKYSTVDNIFNLPAVIQKYLSKNKGRLYVFYIDFFKVYQYEGVRILIYGIVLSENVFLCIFKSMYN